MLFYKQQDDSDGNTGATATVSAGETAAKPTTELQHVGTQDRQLSTPTLTSATKLTPVRLIGVKVKVGVSIILLIVQRQLLELLYRFSRWLPSSIGTVSPQFKASSSPSHCVDQPAIVYKTLCD